MNNFILITGLIFSIIFNKVLAQSDYGEIRGKILNDKTKNGLANFSVILKARNGTSLTTAISDTNGVFVFRTLDSGEYKLSAINKGYRSTHIVEVLVDKDDITFCNIVMKPLSKKNVPEDTTIVRKRPMIDPDGINCYK